MRTHFEHHVRPASRRLADLHSKAANLERELSDTRVWLAREREQTTAAEPPAPDWVHGTCSCGQAGASSDHDGDRLRRDYLAPEPARGHGNSDSGNYLETRDGRTETLVSRGRKNARQRMSRGPKAAAATAVVAALTLAAGVIWTLARDGASWPASVATVRTETARACQNPNVASEPNQVDFACGQATRQILWVFALMTSGNDPRFADARTGRTGLEPIKPAQGGELAWSLNLHHPYSPVNPVDSLQVAARAINNIIGGATLTGTNGSPVVQAGLESSSANCVRYTGSPVVVSRDGFPPQCARPVTGAAGQAALVADVFRNWVVGTPAATARDAAVLFGNASNPGDARVQIILAHLPGARRS